jgi:hypothetical protein
MKARTMYITRCRPDITYGRISYIGVNFCRSLLVILDRFEDFCKSCCFCAEFWGENVDAVWKWGWGRSE